MSRFEVSIFFILHVHNCFANKRPQLLCEKIKNHMASQIFHVAQLQMQRNEIKPSPLCLYVSFIKFILTKEKKIRNELRKILKIESDS